MDKDKLTVDDIIKIVKRSAQQQISESEDLSLLHIFFTRDAVTYLKVKAELRKMIEADIEAIKNQYQLQSELLDKIFQ